MNQTIPAADPAMPILTADLQQLGAPNVKVIVDPETAAVMGAFEEQALSLDDAWDSNMDMAEAGDVE